MSRKKRFGKWPSAIAKGLSLEERVWLLAHARRMHIGSRQSVVARRFLKEWKNGKTFSTDDAFARRLQALALDEGTLMRAAAVPRDRKAREYVRRTNLWQSYLTLATAPSSALDAPGAAEHEFSLLVEPLIDEGINAIRKRLIEPGGADSSALIDTEHYLSLARRQICSEVCGLVEMTCVLELRVAKLKGELKGGTSEERYRSFVDLLSSQAYRRRFFLEYPVLLRVLTTRIAYWRDNTVALAERLHADIDLIRAELLPGLGGGMRTYTAGEGDSHCGGKSVVTLTFEDGRKLVYKPRSLAIEVGFAKLIAWCNAKLPDRTLAAVKTIDRGAYGWCEYIDRADARSQQDIEDFYFRQGKWLAVFHSLQASDLHCENLIAQGSQPIYIDLETLFHPNRDILAVVDDVFVESRRPPTVVDTFILPTQRIAGHSEKEHLDISALSATPSQPLPGGVPGRLAKGTDDSRMGVVGATLDKDAHLPRINGEVAVAADHVEALCAGFNSLYSVLLQAVPEMLASDGPLAFFEKASIRYLHRGTAVYTAILQRSLHPDYLRDDLQRRALFERLFFSHCSQDILNRFLDSEISDLIGHDVPFFARRFSDEAMLDAKGVEVPGFRMASPSALVEAQLRRLGESDRAAQISLIGASLGSPADKEERTACCSDRSTNRPLVDPVAVAERIADHLISRSVVTSGERYWMCHATLDDAAVAVSPGVLNLYSGQLGIAFFLGMLAAATSRKEYEDVALHSIDTVRRWTNGGRRGFWTSGVYGGALGYAYVLSNMGLALERRDLVDEADGVVLGFNPNSYPDGIDVVDGAAGCVLFLAQFINLAVSQNRQRSADAARELLASYAAKLEHHAIAQPTGVGWLPQESCPRPLTGFAHGNAGFSAALHTAASVLGSARYRHLARQAIAYENLHYSTALRAWLDLRKTDAQLRQPISAWCHGAPGILLGRLIALQSAGETEKETLLHDARRAIDSMTQANNSAYLSLCHGALGNFEIMSLATERPDLKEATSALALYEHANARTVSNWYSSLTPTSREREEPGLMAGLSGLGYGLLRQGFPGKFPSVLRLHVGLRN